MRCREVLIPATSVRRCWPTAGARFVIVGHSERRAAYGETNADVRAKALAAFGAGLVPIICVGESHADVHAGRAEAVVLTQLRARFPMKP